MVTPTFFSDLDPRQLINNAAMNQAEISALETLTRDYSETARRVLFVLGSGQSPAVEVFEAAATNPLTNISPDHLVQMAEGRRRSLTLRLPVQMVPDLVRQLAQRNVAVYHVQLLDD
ncbi:MAG: hypothetical protein RLZZ631_1246 [Cyanobacteriota bacterium]|jgi:hypothetical protein